MNLFDKLKECSDCRNIVTQKYCEAISTLELKYSEYIDALLFQKNLIKLKLEENYRNGLDCIDRKQAFLFNNYSQINININTTNETTFPKLETESHEQLYFGKDAW